MHTNQNDIIINKIYNDTLTYENILKLSPMNIIDCCDLLSVSNTISSYFKNNLEKLECEIKLALKLPNNELKIVKLSHHIGFGIQLKHFSGGSINSKIKRVIDSKAIHKKLKDTFDMYKEVYFFSKSNNSYVTDFALKKFEKKILQTECFLKNSVYISKTGQFFPLESLSTSQKFKAKEFHGTCKQLEELATETDKHWLSATITCPPVFHINPVNQTRCWNGVLTPKDANEFQNKIWEDTLRQLAKKQINPFGHWVKEVNKSSAIHRHVLVYGSSLEVLEIKKWLSHYTKSAYKKFNSNFTENGSIQFDCGHCSERFESGVKKSSTIANYLNKAILFCLNLEKRYSSINKQKLDAKTVKKTNAHAEKYKYRRYGFIGLKKCLTLWKQLKYFAKNTKKICVTSPLGKLVEMANNNKLSEFLRSSYRKDLSLIYTSKDEYFDDKKTKYGEKIKKIFGINFKGKNYYTKDQYLSVYEQLITLIKLNTFFMINNHTASP
jgi:hypothetical protein